MATGVLVVEDNELLRDMTAHALRSNGFAVQVSDGTGVQCAAERLQPAVILLDLYLPGADGVAIFRQLKASASTSAIPVVAMTGSMPTDGLGVDDILAKPFTVNMLLHKVRKWADGAR